MRYITNILLIIALLGAVSCTKETAQGDVEGAQPRLMITADDITQPKSRAATEEGTEDERSYNELHLYCFDAAQTLVYQQVVNVTGNFPASVLLPETLENAGNVNFYVFASPNGVTMPGAAATENELKALRTTGMSGGMPIQLQYITADRKIPMSGVKLGHNFKQQGVLQIALTRTVAKLRVRTVDKLPADAGYTFHTDEVSAEFKDMWNEVGYFSSAANPTVAANLFTSQWINATEAKADNSKWVYAYVNEHLSADNRPTMTINLPYTFDGKKVMYNHYEIPLDFDLKRNYIYQLTLNVYSLGEGYVAKVDVEIILKILPWAEEIETDPIE